MPRNALADETSPYLLQHKDNPVAWQPWGTAVLEQAHSQDRPILLSIGYSACHWCHVMAHESFENEEIAALMNELFINVKVGREERPDLDTIYQMALALLGQQGGWPLTMFLTPDGQPFWGGTYFPPASRYGRPGFPDVLRGISETYHAQKDKVLENVKALSQAMADMAKPKEAGELSADVLDQAAASAVRMIDPIRGGTMGAPKFPQPSFFKFLWRAHLRTGSTPFGEAVTVTLSNICQGGIYDHLGGGFARYSTDDAWLAPHFEKMLYDNALLVELLSEVWLETGDPLYAARVRETIEWALREMRVTIDADGGAPFAFASAFDADSEGEEGKFYVWTEVEIDALLGGEAAEFKKVYDVAPGGNWEGHTILNRSSDLGLASEEVEGRLARCRETLFQARAKRVPPGKDDKALTDWNGMMISALVIAGTVFEEPAWTEAARAAFSFVLEHMFENGRLGHSWRLGRLRHAAVVDDYAHLARAALLLFEATGDWAYLDHAEAWVATADSHYWDTDSGAYFLAADDTHDLITRTKTVFDNAVPSGNGVMVEVLARLFYVRGDGAYRDRAEQLVRAFAGQPPEHMANSPTLLNGYELLEGARQIVVVGDPRADATAELTRAALAGGLANRVLVRLAPGADLPAAHAAAGKGLVDGKPAAYVCDGPTCALPVTDGASLRKALDGA